MLHKTVHVDYSTSRVGDDAKVTKPVCLCPFFEHRRGYELRIEQGQPLKGAPVGLIQSTAYQLQGGDDRLLSGVAHIRLGQRSRLHDALLDVWKKCGKVLSATLGIGGQGPHSQRQVTFLVSQKESLSRQTTAAHLLHQRQ